MDKHRRNNHESVLKKYKCLDCPKFFTQPYTMRDHMTVQHKKYISLDDAKGCLEEIPNHPNAHKTPMIKNKNENIKCKCGTSVSKPSNYKRHLERFCKLRNGNLLLFRCSH